MISNFERLSAILSKAGEFPSNNLFLFHFPNKPRPPLAALCQPRYPTDESVRAGLLAVRN